MAACDLISEIAEIIERDMNVKIDDETVRRKREWRLKMPLVPWCKRLKVPHKSM
jgi:hypothetical protein